MNKNTPVALMLFSLSFIIFSSSVNWFMLWLVMEMNTITFITLFVIMKNSEESMMLYFLTQSVASFFLIGATLFSESFTDFSSSFMVILMLSLLMKLGMVPFHNWMLPVILQSNKALLLTLLIGQKIIPFLWILNMKMLSVGGFLWIGLINMMWLSPQNLWQNSMKVLVGLSSMSHSSWLLLSCLYTSLWEIYFLVYTVILLAVIYIGKENFKNIIQNNNPYSILIILLTLGGIPPLMGFFPKMMILLESVSTMLWVFGGSIIMVSLIDLFVYTRLGVTTTMASKSKMKYTLQKTNMKLIFVINIMFVCVLTL